MGGVCDGGVQNKGENVIGVLCVCGYVYLCRNVCVVRVG